MINTLDRWSAFQKELDRRAAEIERLRAALKHIAEHSPSASDFPHGVAGFQRYARQALEQSAEGYHPLDKDPKPY